MASFVWISWIRFVKQLLILILATTMNFTVQNISKRLSGFLNLIDYLSQLILVRIEWLSDLILQIAVMTITAGLFVGAGQEVNCNQCNYYGKVPKKNTQIRCLSVLSAVCYYHLVLNNQILAFRANLINTFASCYV